MKKQTFLLPLLILSLIFTGCSDDDDHDDHSHPVNEEEVITTIEVTLSDGTNSYVLIWEDLDGDGPDLPIITGATIPSNSYDAEIQLYNKTLDPTDDEYVVTTEILEEDVDHQFFFNASNGLNVFNFVYADADVDGNPIGQQFIIEDVSGSGGDLNIVLLHEPNKNAVGVSDGDITNAGGDTDIDITFPIIVQ
ncbi:MAG: type 1 periplasmic binding fold superfamily protein [Flavobacteriaceae bacterium]